MGSRRHKTSGKIKLSESKNDSRIDWKTTNFLERKESIIDVLAPLYANARNGCPFMSIDTLGRSEDLLRWTPEMSCGTKIARERSASKTDWRESSKYWGEEDWNRNKRCWKENNLIDFDVNVEDWSKNVESRYVNVENWSKNAESRYENIENWSKNAESRYENVENWSKNAESRYENVENWSKNAESRYENVENWSKNAESRYENVEHWSKNAESRYENVEDWSKNAESRYENLDDFPKISKRYGGNVNGRNTKVYSLNIEGCGKDAQSQGTRIDREIFESKTDWRESSKDCGKGDWNKNTGYWKEKNLIDFDVNEDWSKNAESRCENVDDFPKISKPYGENVKCRNTKVYSLNIERCSKYEDVDNGKTTNVNNMGASNVYLQKRDISTLDDILKVSCETKSTSTEISECLWLSKGISTLSKNFKDLYRSQRYTDVAIKVQSKEFHAHKLVLITRSDVFASMFQHDTSEKKSGVVEIPDCDPHSFQDFLLYLYTGELDIVSSSNAVSLFKTADKYNLAELQEECIRCMIREITVDSFCHIFHLAVMYDKYDLLSVATNFFISNASAILTSKEWLTLLDEHSSLCNELLVKFAKSDQQK